MCTMDRSGGMLAAAVYSVSVALVLLSGSLVFSSLRAEGFAVIQAHAHGAVWRMNTRTGQLSFCRMDDPRGSSIYVAACYPWADGLPSPPVPLAVRQPSTGGPGHPFGVDLGPATGEAGKQSLEDEAFERALKGIGAPDTAPSP